MNTFTNRIFVNLDCLTAFIGYDGRCVFLNNEIDYVLAESVTGTTLNNVIDYDVLFCNVLQRNRLRCPAL